ncbi:pentapeptide repeat-containing protein [Amycolatopsis anabasis]|uniref:pentapeptide repeat-containing protein n=1 Tax=Amycolatopsis anabasis TaxID=1840409 RepID=UPI00131E1E4F|nr:pentapeptide repeat-containing protein [Amycolatopsis anabasis]
MTDPRNRRPLWKTPLFGTVCCALVLLIAVTGWLFTDKATSRSEALKTGGLAAGALVALYALWLNDRRRQVEERRQETERERYALESERVADERFAKSVELLGHATDQVRVGALHALAGLARSRPSYTQTVLDVLCAYLRRPFHHPRWDEAETDDSEVDRELTVRLTAQRLIKDLLPLTSDAEAPAYDLDLTGAALEYFDIGGRRIGSLIIRLAKLHSSTTFRECEFTGPTWFTEASTGAGRTSGRFHCQRTVFRDRAWFSGTEFNGRADFEGTVFTGKTTFKRAKFSGLAVFAGTTFETSLELENTRFEDSTDLRFRRLPGTVELHNTQVNPARELHLPEGWRTRELRDGTYRITTAQASG